MPDLNTIETCPICETASPRSVRCAHAGCGFSVTACPRCDAEQDVRAFLADHEKDCVHRPAILVQLPAARFRAPSRAA